MYNKLEDCRIDSTLLCSSSFVQYILYHGVRLVVRFKVNFIVIQTHILAFQEDLKYSDFFRDHLPQHIGDGKKRVYSFMDLKWDLKGRFRLE